MLLIKSEREREISPAFNTRLHLKCLVLLGPFWGENTFSTRFGYSIIARVIVSYVVQPPHTQNNKSQTPYPWQRVVSTPVQCAVTGTDWVNIAKLYIACGDAGHN